MLTTVISALVATSILLPGGPPVGMDYLAYDPAESRVWAPGGNTGNVYVFDVVAAKLTLIGGFATAPSRKPGGPRMGPSSVTVGDGVVWIGNRGNNQLAAFDARTLIPKGVIQLPSMPDGLAYVRSTHELWATTPAEKTIIIAKAERSFRVPLDTIALDGAPEGYAVDDRRGIFYTNLEDRGRTLAIDVRTHKVVNDWLSGCAADGPRGLAFDAVHRWLFVACTNGVGVLDIDRGGFLGRITTAGGVDNLDYDPRMRLLFIASAKAGALLIAHVDDRGTPQTVFAAPTAPGARNAVIDGGGTAYVADSHNGRLIVVPAAEREQGPPSRPANGALGR